MSERVYDYEQALKQVEEKSKSYDLNADVDNTVGKVDVNNVLSPGLLNKFDQETNKDWWAGQRQTPQTNNLASLTFTTPVPDGVKTAQDIIKKISDESFKLDNNGDMVNYETAARMFGGDREQMHKFMYATSPEYKQRHDYWMKVDPPAIPVAGPVEGAITAATMPGSFAGNSLKRIGKAAATGIVSSLMNKNNED